MLVLAFGTTAQEMIRPNFLFIGPDKVGSKWLHRILLQHPDCFVPVIADPFFFDRYYDRGMGWYASLFRRAPPACKAIGELSHDYLFSVAAADRIRRDLPGVKLITCLRNPLERTFSQYLTLVRSGMTCMSFEVALDEYPALIDHSLYSRHLQVYLDRFERERLKVLSFETLERDPREFGSEVFDFLGIPFAEQIDYDKRVNSAGMARSRRLAKLVKWGANLARDWSLAQVVGFAKQSPLRTLVYRDYSIGERPNIPATAISRLQEVFSPDIKRLEQQLERSFSHWLAV